MAMHKPIHRMSSWEASSQIAASSNLPDSDWEATRAQTAMATQLLRDRGDYLGDEQREIGRRIDDRHCELFVSCDPGQALRQQLEVSRPEFIAIHDVGTASSRRLVAGIAAAMGRAMQKLVIRRQGLGVALATLEFVELPSAAGPGLRLYTTQVDADTQARHEVALALLAFSRLGVVMVGDLPQHAMASALKPIGDAMHAGPWSNRELLMLPLASASTLAQVAASLGAGSGVVVRTTPQVARPTDAWNYLHGSWSRLRDQLAANGFAIPELGGATATQAQPAAAAAPAAAVSTPPARPASPAPTNMPAAAVSSQTALPMQPMPALPTRAPADATASNGVPGETLLARYVTKLLDINGMVSACVFESATQRPLAHAGARPGPAMLATHGAALVAAMLDGSRALGLGAAPPEAAISFGAHHLVVRPLPGQPGLLLVAVLDKTAANLTLARLQVLRMDSMLESAG